jgi:agmatine deiminase
MCEKGNRDTRPKRLTITIRLPGRYLNFYIGNIVVLVPVFGCSSDETALRIIQGLFPNRKGARVDCSDLVYGVGTLHCISQQQPASEPL